MIRAHLRWLRAALVCLGYVIRPYDLVADRRRWRWQRAGRCGLGGLDPRAREQLLAAVRRKRSRP